MTTIRQRLIRSLLVAITLLLGGGGACVYLATREALLEQFDDALRAKANAISSTTESRGKRVSVQIAEEFMREFDEGVAINFFQVRQADGSTIRRSKSLADHDLPVSFDLGRRPKFWNLTLLPGTRGRAIGYRFSPKNSKEGEEQAEELTIVVAAYRGELDETLGYLALVLLGCGILLLVTTGLVVPRVLRRGLSPLNDLAEQASKIDAGSLSTRFPTDSLPGELKPICDRLNDLLSRLQQSFERERQFSADLAHELRTPIAELRTLADLALKWPETRTQETDRDALAIAVQMEGIVTRLMELLRGERGQLALVREPVQLASLLDKVWQPFAQKSSQKQLNLSLRVPRELRVESDPVLLHSIVANLIDNAVEYTPLGGNISIVADKNGGRFSVEVANSAPNLDAGDLPKFFDRFWRKDASRTGAKRFGLGLSLARAFAQALGCELTAALDEQSRLVLKLSGPLAGSAEPKTSEYSNDASSESALKSSAASRHV